jgi:hypothetical protein
MGRGSSTLQGILLSAQGAPACVAADAPPLRSLYDVPACAVAAAAVQAAAVAAALSVSCVVGHVVHVIMPQLCRG